MRNLVITIFCFGLLVACSDDENIKNESISNKLKLHLTVKDDKKDWNILELAEFKQFPNTDFSLNKIASTYDSIVWKVIGRVEGSFKVFEQERAHTVSRWSNNFYYPGKYEAFLVGYKDNKEFYSDTITLNVSNQKEFLSYNWGEIKSSERAGVGYVNVLSEKTYIVTRQEMYNETPHIIVSTMEENTENQKKFLEEYMTTLFDKPVCDVNSSKNLQNKYYNLFKYKPENITPVAFWITSTSRIMLVKWYSEKQEYYEYFVYAEPYSK